LSFGNSVICVDDSIQLQHRWSAPITLNDGGEDAAKLPEGPSQLLDED
jgi:hypothetical protein